MSPEEAVVQLNSIRAAALNDIEAAETTQRLTELETLHTGRKSPMAQVGRSLGQFSPESRKQVGELANEVRKAIEAALAEKRNLIRAGERAAQLETDRLDVTLPGRRPPRGRLHPLTQVLNEIIDTFVGLGFKVAEGPIVETDYYNFQALNFPQDHPARSMHDTFYVKAGNGAKSYAGPDFLLRTHTSPVQVRLMQSTSPPLYVVIPGVCARRDEIDANHVAVFNQVEGLAVDEGISFSDLKGTLEVFARAMFGAGLRVRTHPSFFPFTEPSAEVYVSCFACDGSGCRTCRGEGWIEIMGAGMVHPNVFTGVGYEPGTTGFAFGMGIERIAKLRYGVSDLRSFYDNDLRFLESF